MSFLLNQAQTTREFNAIKNDYSQLKKVQPFDVINSAFLIFLPLFILVVGAIGINFYVEVSSSRIMLNVMLFMIYLR